MTVDVQETINPKSKKRKRHETAVHEQERPVRLLKTCSPVGFR